MTDSTMFFFLPRALSAWGSPEFSRVFQREVEQLDAALLPLQQGLSHTSSVAEAAFTVLPLAVVDAGDCIRVKAGIFYAGMIGGCNCADDPTPVEAQPEHCELWFNIAKLNGETRAALAPESGV
jgi:hypothetical protein